mmetsp:Transcript_15991/g.41353  ORF Transcript_15991/g.41353 Transcript_15991/m.41353 type:complete len:322 (+) Transcript_15991:182-1147(+)
MNGVAMVWIGREGRARRNRDDGWRRVCVEFVRVERGRLEAQVRDDGDHVGRQRAWRGLELMVLRTAHERKPLQREERLRVAQLRDRNKRDRAIGGHTSHRCPTLVVCDAGAIFVRPGHELGERHAKLARNPRHASTRLAWRPAAIFAAANIGAALEAVLLRLRQHARIGRDRKARAMREAVAEGYRARAALTRGRRPIQEVVDVGAHAPVEFAPNPSREPGERVHHRARQRARAHETIRHGEHGHAEEGAPPPEQRARIRGIAAGRRGGEMYGRRLGAELRAVEARLPRRRLRRRHPHRPPRLPAVRAPARARRLLRDGAV